MKIKPDTIEELIILRRRKRWNQKETAKRIGVPVRTLRAWEQGSRKLCGLSERYLRVFITDELAA